MIGPDVRVLTEASARMFFNQANENFLESARGEDFGYAQEIKKGKK